MSYHYTDSGLDNVFLENGFQTLETPQGTAVSIEDVDGLHLAIGRALIAAPIRLTGAELRFLRLEMDLSQRTLASLLGSTEQNERRYEKARTQPIPGPVDHLLRAIYSEYIGGDGSVRRMVDRLAELDQQPRTEVRFRETERGWFPAETVCAA